MIGIFLLSFSFLLRAENVGLSAYELSIKEKNYLTAEAVAKFTNETGVGFQARWTHLYTEKIKFDGGYAFNSGHRDQRLFAGLDYEIFPDYKLQPRISLKGLVDFVKSGSHFGVLLGVAPIVSKGVAIGSVHTYPFVALPIKRLFSSHSQFEIGINWGVGVSLGDRGVVTFESNINLGNTSGSILIGLSASL